MARSGSTNAEESYGRREFIRFANWMKLALPALAVLLVVLVFLWPRFGQEPESLPEVPAGGSGSAEQGAVADKLQFRGFDKKNQPFNVIAERALQEERGGDELQLIAPAAEILLKEGERLAISAETGYYNRKTDQLRLAGSVKFHRGEDLELTTEEAVLDLKNGTAEGDKPVTAKSAEAQLESEGLRVLDNGKRIIFTGHSRLIVNAESQ